VVVGTGHWRGEGMALVEAIKYPRRLAGWDLAGWDLAGCDLAG
jgi:hypothetical protein